MIDKGTHLADSEGQLQESWAIVSSFLERRYAVTRAAWYLQLICYHDPVAAPFEGRTGNPHEMRLSWDLGVVPVVTWC